MLAGCLVALTLVDPTGAPDVVVTAAPPVNAERLADALRAYLYEYGTRVVAEDAPGGGDLRHQLDEARRAGQAVRAVAVVRAEPGASGSIEIDLVDLATDKALVTAVPRPARDEDLYRALALKIEALLRSTLSEAPERVAERAGVARLAAPAAPGLVASAPEVPRRRWGAEAGYAVLAFPLDGASFQGVAVTGVFSPAPRLELTLGLAGLTSERFQANDVVAEATLVPLVAGVRLRGSRGRFEGAAGVVGEAALASVSASSLTTTPAHSERDAIVALGAEVEGRVRVGPSFWVYLRPTALGVLTAPRYQIEGRTVFDASRFQLTASAGIGIGVR
jgi:hypothetical protein